MVKKANRKTRRAPAQAAPSRAQRAFPRAQPMQITVLPPPRRVDGLASMSIVPSNVEAMRDHYLSQLPAVRADSLLDGLIGMDAGWSGGGWKNFATGHGTFARDKVMQGHFSEPYRLTDPELSALYNGNDLAKRIIDTVPREMFRRGWTLVIGQDLEDDDDAGGTDGPDTASEAFTSEYEQKVGGESGPAAPGAPLVDPMGAPPDNAVAKVPPPEDTNGVGKDQDPEPRAPAKDPAGESAPFKAAPGAESPDPMGEKLAKAPPPKPADGTKPAPAKVDQPAPAKVDQPDGADLAIAAEAYAARIGLKARCLESCIFGSLYGGGLLIVGADDGGDMSLPLDESKIKTIRYLAWIDRRFIFANTWYAEIGPKYGEVETWQIVNPFGGETNQVVHESRCIRFDGAPVDFLMRRRLLGWTLSNLQAPYDVMRQFDLSFQSVSNLMADLSQAVMKINGLAQLISNDQTTLNTRMQMVDISRSSARMLYLDAENEDFERTATPLTGVADTISMQMLRMAAAAEMPVAILFGREPSGLNATGDADFRRFYDVIAGKQRTELEPKLRRLYSLIFAAKDGPTKGVQPKGGFEFIWHKLYAPSELEQAQIRFFMAQADEKYVANEILLPEEVALSRFRNGDLNLETEIVTELRDESLKDAELAPSGAAKAEAEAQQAKDLAKGAVATKGAPAGVGPNKAKTKPAGVKKPGGK